jgi:hypothetical protein
MSARRSFVSRVIPISSLSLGLGARCFPEHVDRGDINRQAEGLSRFAPQGGQVEKRTSRLQIDQKVDVALRSRLPTSHGPEDT